MTTKKNDEHQCDGPLICGHCDEQVGTHADESEPVQREVVTRVPTEQPEEGWQPGDIVMRPFVHFQMNTVQRVGKVLSRERHYIVGGITKTLVCVEWMDNQVEWGFYDEGLYPLDKASLGGMHTMFTGPDMTTYALLCALLPFNKVLPPGYWEFDQQQKLDDWIKARCPSHSLFEYFGIRMHRVHVWDDTAKTWCESCELQDLLNDGMDPQYATVYWPEPKYRLERIKEGKDPVPVVRLTQITDDLGDPADREELNLGKGKTKDYDVPEKLWGVADDEKVLDWFHTTVPIGCVDDYEWEVIRGNGAQVSDSEGGDGDHDSAGDGVSDASGHTDAETEGDNQGPVGPAEGRPE